MSKVSILISDVTPAEAAQIIAQYGGNGSPAAVAPGAPSAAPPSATAGAIPAPSPSPSSSPMPVASPPAASAPPAAVAPLPPIPADWQNYYAGVPATIDMVGNAMREYANAHQVAGVSAMIARLGIPSSLASLSQEQRNLAHFWFNTKLPADQVK